MSGSPSTRKSEASLQFNIVYTPGTVRYLRVFVSSLLAFSAASFRLVANGCSAAEREELRRCCAGHPRLEYLELLSPEVQRHGKVLNYLQSMTRTPYFCVMDSDIFATASWLDRSSERLQHADAVFSGMPLWVARGDDRFPGWFKRLSGEYSHDARGHCLGVTYVAMYDNDLLSAVRAREQVGFEGREWSDVPPRLHSALAAQGLLGRHFDTGKLLNVLMRASHRLEFVEEPGLCHVGGASFEVIHRRRRQLRPQSIVTRLGERGYRPLVTAWRILQQVHRHRRQLPLREAFVVMRRRIRHRDPVRSHMVDVLHALFEGSALPCAPDLGSSELNARLEAAARAAAALFENEAIRGRQYAS
jgi:hypothetical protein